VLDVSSAEVYTPRSTQQQIIDFIIGDLDTAAAKLVKQRELSPSELGRVTQGAALALKARAALYQGTWFKYHGGGDPTPYLAAAISAAQQLVASGEYQLDSDQGAQSYKYLFILQGDDSKEVILAKRYWAGIATHNWTRELWFNYMIPTKKLADMYLATDGLPITSSPLFKGYDSLTSEFQNRDPRMAMTFVVPGSNVFQGNGLDMLTEIRRERTVELAFEGFRRDDLRRWKTAETEMPQALRGVKFVGTQYQQRDTSVHVGRDVQVDPGGFIVAEAAASRQF